MKNGKINCSHELEELIVSHRTGINDPKFCVKPQKMQNSQAVLRKKNKAGGIVVNDFKLDYITIHVTASFLVAQW